VIAGDTKTERALEKLLVERALAGDKAALRELIDQHKDRLFAFIWRMVRDHHDAEDICQDAFLKAFASLASFSTEYRFSTWLFTIAYRVSLNKMRRKRALTGDVDFTTLPFLTDEDPDAALESEDAARVRELIWEAVDRLSPPQRACVLLFYRHEMSCQEISRVIQLPLATVKSHLHRARAKLREMLEPVSESELQVFRNLSVRTG
jgi:RNA polymerase sigma-70 factor (ECF subfamily)